MYRKSNFRPNAKGHVRHQDGYDVTGRPTFSRREKVGLTILKFDSDIQSTSIRADKSGTKSRAEERIRAGRVMIEPKAEFEIGFLLEINGEQWRIDSKFPRYDQNGILHHYQVDLTAWA